MKKTFLVLAAATLLFSCSKSDSTPTITSASIQGNWKLLDLQADTYAEVIINGSSPEVKTVTTSNYTTIENVGTVLVDASNFNSVGIGYKVASTATAKTYSGGALVSTNTQPVNATQAPSNGVSAYRLFGADSIAFTGGTFGTTSTTPSNAKIALNGNIMTLTSGLSVNKQITQGGIPYTQIQKATAVYRFQKQ
jgi:hypothetical protein